GVADARVDPRPLVERAAAVNADQLAVHVEQRAPGVAGVDGGVDLQAVGVLQQGPLRVLVAVHAADQAEGDRGCEVGGQQEGVAHGQGPVALAALVAVAQGGEGELLAVGLGQQLDQGDVADLVEPDQDRVVQDAVGQAALHAGAGPGDDVEVGQGV